MMACALLNAVEVRRYLTLRGTSWEELRGNLPALLCDRGLVANRVRSPSFHLLWIAAVGFGFMAIASAQYDKLGYYLNARDPWLSLQLAAWRSERFLYSAPVFAVPLLLAFLAARRELARHPGESGPGVSSHLEEVGVVGAANPRYRNRAWAAYYEVGGVFRASPDAPDPDRGRRRR